MFTYTLPIIIIPALMFLFLGLMDDKFKPMVSGILGTLGLGTVTILSYLTAYDYFFSAGLVDGVYERITACNFEWLKITENLHIDLGILLDPISVMMLVVISTVSLMVHIYSFGYMNGEKGFQRYYALLSLFSFSMLGLVVATNIFQMYIFWELVGVSSYSLIGFYYTKKEAIAASKKAFIVTRFADMFFLIGILLYGYYADTFSFDFTESGFSQAAAILPLALVLMFIGGAGKSAMFPLHIWLPDAMEGPTPVSALIHAATMVVAGVYQIARLFPLWINYAPDSLSIVVWVGAITAFYAAAVACAQSDIKRVLAFSTISQIAFMMVALGVCMPGHESVIDAHGSLGYMASMFHLFTHAMFKACLFLCAGCIIHAVHSNEMSTMGGLRKYMPITHITFLISCLAISGIPFFSGFSSKDEIMSACFAFSPYCGIWMTMVAAMTAFYMFRLYYGIFWGTENKELHEQHTPHEAPLTMTIPLIVLSTITVLVGIVSTLGGFLHWDWASFGKFVSANGEGYTIHFDAIVATLSTIIALGSIALATYIYKGEKQPIADEMQARFPKLHHWAYKRFFMDEVWLFVTKNIIFQRISQPIAWFDRHVVDGFMNALAWITNFVSQKTKYVQSGLVQDYATIFIGGALAIVLIMILI